MDGREIVQPREIAPSPPQSYRELLDEGLPRVGDVLGAYRVLECIGLGGVAVVYRAQHIKLAREVALKVLRPSLAEKSMELSRFLAEARAVNEIQHPGIVEIIDIVEQYNRTPPLVYMVMELLDGQDLHARIASRGALELQEAVSIACEVADALTAAHNANILHRDLKPGNVFLSRGETQTRVKLLDFGLFKHFGERAHRHLTQPEVMPGTPQYMSPEQIMGQPLGPGADIYAFGLLLYEMLAGSPPFVAKTNTELLVMHAKEPAPSLGERRADVPPGLQSAVMRCLAKDSADRFGSIEQAKSAMVNGLRSSSDCSMSHKAIGSPRPRWRVVWAAAALATLLAGVGLLWGGVLRDGASEVRTAPPTREVDNSASGVAGEAKGASEPASQSDVPQPVDAGPTAKSPRELLRQRRARTVPGASGRQGGPKRRIRAEGRGIMKKRPRSNHSEPPVASPSEVRPDDDGEETLQPYTVDPWHH